MTTKLAEHPFDAFDAHCPSRRLLDTIGDKWASLAIVALGVHGSLRYSELSDRIAGVSQKMLTQTLRNLERDGLLTRTVTPSATMTRLAHLSPIVSNSRRLGQRASNASNGCSAILVVMGLPPGALPTSGCRLPNGE